MDTLNKIAAALKVGVSISNAGQAYALLRGFLVALGTLLSLLGFASALSPERITWLIQVAQAIGVVLAALSAIVGALMVFLPPVVASFKASPQERISDVSKIANDPTNLQSQSAKVALITATDSLPEVMGVPTANTPAGHALANAVPSNTVQVVKP